MPEPDTVIPVPAQDPLTQIRRQLDQVRNRLLSHPVYERLDSIESLRCFTEAHCFAVWDFMCLLKSLQQRLTCTEVPWRPPEHREGARLINEIVVAEESDESMCGSSHLSHFELYLEAMRELGADTSVIEAFVARLADHSWQEALADTQIPPAVREFVTRTLTLCEEGETWEIAAEFVLGREKLIPDMFREISLALAAREGLPTAALNFYLDRHIELDEDEHGPAGEKLLRALCEGEDELRRWQAVERVAQQAIEARSGLWDGALSGLSAVAR